MEETTTPAPVSTAPVTPVAPKKSHWDGAVEFGKFIFFVLAVVVVVRVFIAQPFVVSGTSMVPTFADKNYLIIDELTYRFREPVMGEVIVFHPPVDSDTYYIKRVIGIPGDTVTIKNGKVTVTNAAHPDGLALNEDYITTDTPDDNYTVTVPEDKYFVMGDNRPASFDSRRWGLLPKKNIIGRVFLRLFPVNQIDFLPGAHTKY